MNIQNKFNIYLIFILLHEFWSIIRGYLVPIKLFIEFLIINFIFLKTGKVYAYEEIYEYIHNTYLYIFKKYFKFRSFSSKINYYQHILFTKKSIVAKTMYIIYLLDGAS